MAISDHKLQLRKWIRKRALNRGEQLVKHRNTHKYMHIHGRTDSHTHMHKYRHALRHKHVTKTKKKHIQYAHEH